VRIALLGPPGAGKGSLAAVCARRIRLKHLSTGEIFRREIAKDSVVGRQVRRFVQDGRLVPDALVVTVMAKHLKALPARRGFVLDGFPRTAGQARGLDVVLQRVRRGLDGAVYLEAPQTVLVRRLSGRRVCTRCGANYHVRTMRPRRAGRCDRCGTPLRIRDDDRAATVKRRLAVDRRAARPLLRYYQGQRLLHRVNAAGSLDQMFVRLMKVCRASGWLSIDD